MVEEEDIHPLEQLEGLAPIQALEGLAATEEEDEEDPVDHQEGHSKGQPGLDRLSMKSMKVDS